MNKVFLSTATLSQCMFLGATNLETNVAQSQLQDMVDFLEEAENAITSFHATQAGAC